MQPADSEDGVVDILIAIARKITELLKKDIDTLNLPPVLVKPQKVLKALVNLFKLKKCQGQEDCLEENVHLEDLLLQTLQQ